MNFDHLRGAHSLLEQVERLEEHVNSLICEGNIAAHLQLISEVMTNISDCAQMLVGEFNKQMESDQATVHQGTAHGAGAGVDRMLMTLKGISSGMDRIKRKINGSMQDNKIESGRTPLN